MCLTPFPTSTRASPLTKPVKRRSNANKLKPFTFHIINFTETSGPESPTNSSSSSLPSNNNSLPESPSNHNNDNSLNGFSTFMNNQHFSPPSSPTLNNFHSVSSPSYSPPVNNSTINNTTPTIKSNTNSQATLESTIISTPAPSTPVPSSTTTTTTRKTYVACSLATAAPQNALIKSQIDKYIHLPQPEAAKRLGISLSTLKRRFYETYPGQRWPHTASQQATTTMNIKKSSQRKSSPTMSPRTQTPTVDYHVNSSMSPAPQSSYGQVIPRASSTMMSPSSPTTINSVPLLVNNNYHHEYNTNNNMTLPSNSSSSINSTMTLKSITSSVTPLPPIHTLADYNNHSNYYRNVSTPMQQCPPISSIIQLARQPSSKSSISPPPAKITKSRKMSRELLVNSSNKDEKFIDALTMQALQSAFSM